MKKILLMTIGTALLGTGAIAEGVSISGSADMGVEHSKSTITWISNFNVGFSASGTTDGGLTFGAATQIEANGNDDSKVDNSKVYVSGEAWKLEIGDLDPASDMAKTIPDVGYNGLGVDDVAEKAVDSTGADAKASFTLGNASLGITTAPNEKKNDWAVGLSVDAGNMTFSAGTDSQKLVAVGATASLGGITTAVYYAKDQDEVISMVCADGSPMGTKPAVEPDEYIFQNVASGDDNDRSVTVSDLTKVVPAKSGCGKDYTKPVSGTVKQSGLGASASFAASENTTVKIVWAKGKGTFSSNVSADESYSAYNKTMDKDGIGIGISTVLGGGATLQAGIAKVGGESAVSAGIGMKF